MNIFRIALFIFLIQQSFIIVSAMNIALRCNSDYSACIYFDAGVISAHSLGDIIIDKVDTGEYISTQITQNVGLDAYLNIPNAINFASDVLSFSLFGMWNLVRFFLGHSAVITVFAAMLQGVVYFFYACMISSKIREGAGEI